MDDTGVLYLDTTSRILLTGGSGFLGSAVEAELKRKGFTNVMIPRSREFDLRKQDQVQRLVQSYRPTVIIHLAAVVGGIGANQKNPGRFLYENAIMGLLLMEEARALSVNKFVTIGTICEYPKFTPVPFLEDNLWNGYPEETNAPYGLAKKLLLAQGQAYRQQYNMNVIHLLPVNLYGPGDNFDLESSHVIPAMIRKCLDAASTSCDQVVFWGDGTPTREFLFVEEAARAIVLATELYDGTEPVNLGSGMEISMSDLGSLIAELTGFQGSIVWDASRPNGQPRRMLDVQRAKVLFGFESRVSFREGLTKTIQWYRSAARQEVVSGSSN